MREGLSAQAWGSKAARVAWKIRATTIRRGMPYQTRTIPRSCAGLWSLFSTSGPALYSLQSLRVMVHTLALRL